MLEGLDKDVLLWGTGFIMAILVFIGFILDKRRYLFAALFVFIIGVTSLMHKDLNSLSLDAKHERASIEKLIVQELELTEDEDIIIESRLLKDSYDIYTDKGSYKAIYENEILTLVEQ